MGRGARTSRDSPHADHDRWSICYNLGALDFLSGSTLFFIGGLLIILSAILVESGRYARFGGIVAMGTFILSIFAESEPRIFQDTSLLSYTCSSIFFGLWIIILLGGIMALLWRPGIHSDQLFDTYNLHDKEERKERRSRDDIRKE